MAVATRHAGRWLLTVLLFSTFGLLTIIISGVVIFGSMAAALAELRGDALILEMPKANMGHIAKGSQKTATFRISNRSEHAINLIGAHQSCSCIVFYQNFPMLIPSHGYGSVVVNLMGKGKVGDTIDEYIKVYTDYPGQPTLELEIIGILEQSASEQPNSTRPMQTQK